jgi:hypothetical protein
VDNGQPTEDELFDEVDESGTMDVMDGSGTPDEIDDSPDVMFKSVEMLLEEREQIASAVEGTPQT